MGQAVDLTDNNGKLLEKTRIDFISPEVDSNLQGILVKASVQSTDELRNAQIVKAQVIWSTKPMAVVPVLAVTRQGEQSFVYLVQKANGMTLAHRAPVTLGDTVGNNYSIAAGLNAGDQVIVSGTQFLVDGMPVVLLPGAPPAAQPAANAAGAQNTGSATQMNKSAPRPVVASHHRHGRHRRSLAKKSGHAKPVQIS
jgi:multidrug efflux pump subunit AcrA (membrane-fusion protein)